METIFYRNKCFMNPARQLLREIMRISRQDLPTIASLSKIPQTTVYDIYKGQTRVPTDITFQKLFYYYCKLVAQSNCKTDKKNSNKNNLILID